MPPIGQARPSCQPWKRDRPPTAFCQQASDPVEVGHIIEQKAEMARVQPQINRPRTKFTDTRQHPAIPTDDQAQVRGKVAEHTLYGQGRMQHLGPGISRIDAQHPRPLGPTTPPGILHRAPEPRARAARDSGPPEVPMQLVRSHGLGNDYLVLMSGETLDAATVRALCDRHTGVGGDGVLEPLPGLETEYGLRIWNPDGSLAEKSGNGLRIFARYLVDHQLAPLAFSVEVAAGLVQCEVNPASGDVTVDMGIPTFNPSEIPCDPRCISEALPLDCAPGRLGVIPVGMGNPHAVVRVDHLCAPEEELDRLPWRMWGAALEHHPWFPNRTNVQFARVLSPDTVECRIWERGAGETTASGSSACAVVAALQREGVVGPEVAVRMPGGTLALRRDVRGHLHQRGPVEEIAIIHTTRTFGGPPR
jgi:diaminopimelate epimerase